MRENQRLTFAQLREEAKTAADRYDGTREELASELGVGRSWLSRALNEEGSKFVSLQRKVIEKLTDYRVKEEPEIFYRVERK